jgi:hypothetical protein
LVVVCHRELFFISPHVEHIHHCRAISVPQKLQCHVCGADAVGFGCPVGLFPFGGLPVKSMVVDDDVAADRVGLELLG